MTGRRVPPERKKPYSPELAAQAVQRDARDFVDTVVARLRSLRASTGRPALTVAAFDTELFGHWWHEGPDWLAAVLRLLPEAGVADLDRLLPLLGVLVALSLWPPLTTWLPGLFLPGAR